MGIFYSKIQSISKFYKFFVDETNDGVVLDLDISRRTDLGVRKNGNAVVILTTDEVQERRDWNRSKEEISEYYGYNRSPVFPNHLSQEEFLNLRTAAPCLTESSRLVSERSPSSAFRQHRHYPKEIQVWHDFRPSVEQFKAGAQQVVPNKSVGQVRGSLNDLGLCAHERSEEDYLDKRVLQPLMVAGLIGTVRLGPRGCKGEPDFSLLEPDTDNVKIVGETKATHNLPLPMQAQMVVEQYNTARSAIDNLPEERTNIQRRPLGWSHVGHPVSQALGYMILNHCRYGVLTSGSRTYFIHVQTETATKEEKVFISDAWFVGQENYLRAWAFLYDRACEDRGERLSPGILSETWLTSTPERANKRPPSPDGRNQANKRSRLPGFIGQRGGQGRGKRRSLGRDRGLSHSQSIPRVSLNDFEVGRPIGYGRRGTVFSGTWNGEVVALKLFDSSKNNGWEAFMHEMEAYEHLGALGDAWGRLVPTPKFTAEAFGVSFLGMQMAESPSQSDCEEDWDDALFELEQTYGFRHLDVDGSDRGPDCRNRMILRDKTGCRRPIIIDLEEFEFV